MAHALNRNSTAESRINLTALQRIDPYIGNIITSATQVALYKFVSNEWEKTETEGTLFVYERQGDPQYGFIILNRLSPKNLVEPVTKELDFQLQSPFMLYKTKEGHIFGIWFYDAKECERVTKTIQDLVHKTEEKMKKREAEAPKGDLAHLLAKASSSTTPAAAAATKSPNKGGGGDKLMKLLTPTNRKQQPKHDEEPDSPPTLVPYPKMSPAAAASHPAAAAAPQNSEGNNVAAFFAQAASEQSAFSSPIVPSAPPSAAPLAQHQRQPQMLPHHPIPLMHPSLMHPHQLMQLLPHQIAAAHVMAMQGMPPMFAAANNLPRPPMMMHQQHSPQQQREQNAPELMARLMSNPNTHSVEFLERQQRLESLSPRNPEEVIEQQHRSYASAAAAATPKANRALDLEAEEEEPKLISPMVFAQQKSLAPQHPKETRKTSNNGSRFKSMNGDRGEDSSTEIAPLTQQQLQQAFQHLLRTDNNFVAKLHQAYVESLNTKLQ